MSTADSSTAAQAAATAPTLPERGISARLGALRYPAYRRYWFGSIASVGGFNLNVLAQGILVFKLTGSPLDLGLVGAATAVPTIVVNLFGGVLADRFDRRKLLMATQVALAALLALLATLDATGAIEVWHIYVIAAITGLVTGVDWPIRTSMFAALIERKAMMSAVALNSVLWQGSRVVIPTVGGNLIALFGTAPIFYLASGGFVTMFLLLVGLHVPQADRSMLRNPWREFVDGVKYIAGTRLFAVLIPLTFANMFFGLTYIQLMPAYADLFGGGPRELGYLFSSAGVGAVAGTLLVSRLSSRRRMGWMILGGSFVFATLTVLVAFSPAYLSSMALLLVAGVFNSVFFINSMTALQMRVPDQLRGRVMGIHGITFSLIPLGGLFGGAIADTWNVRIAIAVGAIVLAVIVAAVTATQRELRELDGNRLAESG